MKFFCLILLIFLVGCQVVPLEKSCSADGDCVPAQCCHADEAVNKDYGPDCTGKMCTMECVSRTLNCGQGEVRCVSGECQAVLKE